MANYSEARDVFKWIGLCGNNSDDDALWVIYSVPFNYMQLNSIGVDKMMRNGIII